MNIKILEQLELMFRTSPQLLCDYDKLKKALQVTFNVDIDIGRNYFPESSFVYFREISQLVKQIDELVLEKYFSEVWQSRTKKYKYSGLKLIDEVNSLKPIAGLDAGGGFNEFKGKIHNLTGIDPYNSKADVRVKITDYAPDKQFDVIICLGSINFGSTIGSERTKLQVLHLTIWKCI